MNRKRLHVLALFASLALLHTGVAATSRDPFLEEVEKRAFLFFWNETDPVTGVTKDRANAFKPDTYEIGSIAATGFALSALPIGVKRGWVARKDAEKRALLTLRFFDKRAARIHGVFPHFLKFGTGERAWNCEYSTIDTTLLCAGAITAGEFFGGETKAIAERLYRAIDWVYWSPRGFVCMGSRPQEAEFLDSDYGGYCEAVLLYIMAIGSPTHPIPAAPWEKMGRWVARYGALSSIAGSSLFVNQYQNLWIDLHGMGDGHADYWENARTNTLANRQFCIDQSSRYAGYGPDVWGLTAGDGPDGYQAYSAEPGGANTDGTINPHAAGGSYMFTPVESRRALKEMLARYRGRIWGRYGFSDGFNVGRNWWASDVIGIDTGATLLSIENYRTGLIQRLFMHNPAARTAFHRIGMVRIPRPSGTQPVRASGVLTLKPGHPASTSFSLPQQPPGWKGRSIVLYGGVIEERTVSVTLNGIPLDRAIVPHGSARAVAFDLPRSILRWGGRNRIAVTLERGTAATYGPIYIGPREGVDYLPLKVLPPPK